MDFRGIATTKVSFERHAVTKRRQGTIKYGGSNGVCFQLPRTTFSCTGPETMRLIGCQPVEMVQFWEALMERFRRVNALEDHPFQATPPIQFRIDQECAIFDSDANPMEHTVLERGSRYTGSCIVNLDKTWMTFDDTGVVLAWGLSATITQFKVYDEIRPTPQFFFDGKALFLSDD